MTVDAAGQWRHQHASAGHQPSLATVADDPGVQHQILHDIIVIPFEARTCWNPHGGDELLLDTNTWRQFAASTPLRTFATRWCRRRLLHATRLDVGTALQPLQPRDLLTLLRHHAASAPQPRPECDHQSLQLCCGQCIEIQSRRHRQNESEHTASGEPKSPPSPPVLPRLLCHWTGY